MQLLLTLRMAPSVWLSTTKLASTDPKAIHSHCPFGINKPELRSNRPKRGAAEWSTIHTSEEVVILCW